MPGGWGGGAVPRGVVTGGPVLPGGASATPPWPGESGSQARGAHPTGSLRHGRRWL